MNTHKPLESYGILSSTRLIQSEPIKIWLSKTGCHAKPIVASTRQVKKCKKLVIKAGKIWMSPKLLVSQGVTFRSYRKWKRKCWLQSRRSYAPCPCMLWDKLPPRFRYRDDRPQNPKNHHVSLIATILLSPHCECRHACPYSHRVAFSRPHLKHAGTVWHKNNPI